MKQQILVIDDTKQIHALVSGILSGEPVDLHFASNGSEGMTLVDSVRPDLILLDVEMPVLDGYATCRLLKAEPAFFNIPVIFLTSRSTIEQKVRGLELGAVDYITKPFSPPELLARVRAALRTSRAIKLLEEHALIDFLTGLGNRAMFKQRLAAEVSLRIRTKKPLACLMVDVDDFQAINDTQGHPFADRVLQDIAQVIQGVVRMEDVACRLGGDAFAIIMPNTELEDTRQLAERISRDLSQLKFAHLDTEVNVACSVAVAPAIDTYDRGMFERATAAIEEARTTGVTGVLVANRDNARANAAA
jgi:diguanylate cyclase (GGDEF)-like protein